MVDGLRYDAGVAGGLNAEVETRIAATVSSVIHLVGLMKGKALGCSHVFLKRRAIASVVKGLLTAFV
jgi:hypothetical protein